MLFWVVLVCAEGRTFAGNSPNTATIVSKLPVASAFTNVYGIYGTNFIAIAPWTSQGIFYQGDPVTISTVLVRPLKCMIFMVGASPTQPPRDFGRLGWVITSSKLMA